jgi:hypothetical protein
VLRIECRSLERASTLEAAHYQENIPPFRKTRHFSTRQVPIRTCKTYSLDTWTRAIDVFQVLCCHVLALCELEHVLLPVDDLHCSIGLPFSYIACRADVNSATSRIFQSRYKNTHQCPIPMVAALCRNGNQKTAMDILCTCRYALRGSSILLSSHLRKQEAIGPQLQQ